MSEFPSDFQSFIHKSKYARWIESAGKRESWLETVERYVSFFDKRFPGLYPKEEIKEAIYSLSVMPSMRAMMTAGPALDRDEIAGYNCSYVAIDHPRAFDEILYILSCGTGVGFSVERQNIAKLPTVPDELFPSDTTVVVKDSKIGWASAYRELISLLYAGNIPTWDVSKVRPAGARLKIFGGRASGPGPLVDLFNFTIEIFKSSVGRKLTSLECHDICCKIGDVIISGGVRRSALISLSNLSDDRMRSAKTGKWYETEGQRALANNSAVYTERPDMGVFFKEWMSLYESKSGERGIFSRVAAQKKAKENGRREFEDWEFGTNPCLTGDSIVETSKGSTTMKELASMDEASLLETQVKTWDPANQVETFKPLCRAFLTKRNASIIQISVKGTDGDIRKLKLTPDHKVYTKNRGWIEASKLTEDDVLVLADK